MRFGPLRELYGQLKPRLKIFGPAILLCLALSGFQNAWGAQAAQSHPDSAVNATPRLSASQAQQLIHVLNDDAQRRQFVATLENLTKAQGVAVEAAPSKATTPAAVASTPAAPQAVAESLEPDSLGAQVLGSVSTFGDQLQSRAQAVATTVLDFGTIGPWARHIANSPADRAKVYAILIRVGIFVALVGTFVFLARLAIRRPRHVLEEAARSHGLKDIAVARSEQRAAESAVKRDVEAEERVAAHDHSTAVASDITPISGAPDGDPEPTKEMQIDVVAEGEVRLRHQGALARLMLAVRRIPYTLGCFVLDMIPVAAVPVAALLVKALDPASTRATTAAMRDLVLCGIIGGSIVCIARALFSPSKPWLRLMTIGNAASAFLFSWLQLLVLIGTCGAAALSLMSDCSLPLATVLALAKLLALVLHLLVAVMIVRARPYVTALCKDAKQDGVGGYAVSVLNRVWWVAALFFDIGLWLVWAAELPNGYTSIWRLFLRTVVALVVLRLFSIAIYGLLERFFRNLPEWIDLNDETKARVGSYYPIVRWVAGGVIGILTVVAIALAWGVPLRSMFGDGQIGSRVLGSTFTILVALAIASIVWECANLAIERHVTRVSAMQDGSLRAARIRTLQPMIRIALLVVLGVVVALTILSEIGVNTGPLLAGASIFGVALGFGSQKLVQDFINGIFLLLENALTVGDSVSLNGVGGTVEHLSLRTVHVRGSDGSMNIFPFSSLGQITNFNRDYARAAIAASVGYDVDTDDVVKALKDIASDMRSDPDFSILITDDIQIWGVDSLGDSSVTVRGVLPTTTGGRWPVQREFNRRMKKCFDERGITIPFPTRTLEIDGLDRLFEGSRGRAGVEAAAEPGATGTSTSQVVDAEKKP